MQNIEGKPFTDVLGEINGGEFLRDLTKACYEVVQAVMDTRKPGSLKIAVKITPTGRASVEVDAKLDHTVPEHDKPSTTFFVTPEATLLRSDPSQPRLPLREVVDQNTGEIREVAEARG